MEAEGMNKKTFLMAVAICVTFACCKQTPTEPEKSYIEALLDYYHVPGVSVAVIKDFQIDRLEVYGVKDVTSDEPVTEETLFQAASISKPVSAMTAMKLVQEGKIGLDNNINDVLTSWKVADNTFTAVEKVTLRRLLSHTAGTVVYGCPGYLYSEDLPTLIQILNGTPPAKSPPIVVSAVPGTIFRYSNNGFCILQQAVMDIEQKDFPQIQQVTILTPLAMLSSTFEQPLPESRRVYAATGHYTNGTVIPGGHYIYPEMAAGGLWTTPADLARFLIEMQLSLEGLSNLMLTQFNAELMLTSVLDPGYGLGFELFNINGEPYFGHGGATIGFRCIMRAHETAGVGAVIMTNGENADTFCVTLMGFIAHNEGWPGY
jgi:CubicO group peptidase (beta-lactamase class C family)